MPPSLEDIAGGTTTFEALVAERAGDVDLSVPTDDRPFFWSFEPGLPRTLVLLLAAALPLAVVALLLLVGPAWRQHGPSAGGLTVAAAGLGTAFLGVQLIVLSLAMPWLGRPDLTFAGVLGGMLLGAGVGSGLLKPSARLSRATLTAAAASLVGLLGLAWLELEALPSGLAGIFPFVVVFGVGVAAGRPFPIVLRQLAGVSAGSVARAWAVSGVGALVAGVLALALPHTLGLTMTGLVFAVAYAVTAVLTSLDLKVLRY